MDPDYIESILVLKGSGGAEIVRRWFEHHGLQAMKLRAGFLITGSRDAYEKALGMSLKGATPPVDLPIPRELSKYVASIRIPTPRQIV